MGSFVSKQNFVPCSSVTFSEEDRKNARYHNPFSNQNHCVSNGEGLIVGSRYNEKRTKATPVPKYLGSAVGQLWMKYNGETFVGTGSIVSLNGKSLILTCAHNVVQVSPLDHSVKYVQGGEFFPGRTKNSQPTKYKITGIYVFPDYLRPENISFHSGNDFALLGMELMEGEEDTDAVLDAHWDTLRNSDKGIRAKIYGYPGEEDKCGDPYEMEGSISKFVKNGKLVLYRDIDTTGGQSGSPVLVKRNHCSTWTIVAVHVGTTSDHQGSCNAATAISEKLFTWMQEIYSSH